VEELYRPNAKLGNGSAMDADRIEGGHGQKLMERQTQLTRLSRDPKLSATDREIVVHLLNDIQQALSGK
jgi:hypothetical protein